jgi:hypothetical protein
MGGERTLATGLGAPLFWLKADCPLSDAKRRTRTFEPPTSMYYFVSNPTLGNAAVTRMSAFPFIVDRSVLPSGVSQPERAWVKIAIGQSR